MNSKEIIASYELRVTDCGEWRAASGLRKFWEIHSGLFVTLLMVMGLLTVPVSAETVQEILNRVDGQWLAGEQTRAVELIDDWLKNHSVITDCLPLIEYLQRRRQDRLALERLYRLDELYARPGTEEAGLQGARKLLLMRQRQLATQNVCKRILLLECDLIWSEDYPVQWWEKLTGRLTKLEEPDRQKFIAELLKTIPVYWLGHDGFSRFRENSLAGGLSIANLEPFLIARLREAEDLQTMKLAEQLFSPPEIVSLLVLTRRFAEAEARLGESPQSLMLRQMIYKETGRWEEFRRELPELCQGVHDRVIIPMLSSSIDFQRTDETNLRLARALMERSLQGWIRAETSARLILARDHALRGETAEALKLLPPVETSRTEREWSEAWRLILRAFGQHGSVTDDMLRKLFPSPREAERGHDWPRELADGLALLEGLELSGRDHPRLTSWTLEAASHVNPDHLRYTLNRQDDRLPRTAMLLVPLVLLREEPGRLRRSLETLARRFGWKPVLERMLQDDSCRRILWEKLSTERFSVDAEGIQFLNEQLSVVEGSRKPLEERLAMVQLQMQSGQGTEAIVLLELELTTNPQLEERRWEQLGQYYLQNHQFQRGEKFFRALASRRIWPALYWSAALAVAAGRTDAALQDLQRLRPTVVEEGDPGRVYSETVNRFHAQLTGKERRVWLESCLTYPVQGWEGVLVIWMNDRLQEGDTTAIELQIESMNRLKKTSCNHLLLLIGPAKDRGTSIWLETQLIGLGQNPDWLRKSIKRRMELREKSLAVDLSVEVRSSLLQGHARQLIAESTNPLTARVELALYFSSRDREFALELGQEALRQNGQLDLLEPRLTQVDSDFTRELFKDTPAWLRTLTGWCFNMERQNRHLELRDELLRVQDQIGLMSAIRLLLMNSSQNTESVALLETAERMGTSLRGRERVELIVRLAGSGRGIGLLQRLPLSPEDVWQGRQQLKPVWKTLLIEDPEAARALLETFRYRINTSERDELVNLLGDEFWRIER